MKTTPVVADDESGLRRAARHPWVPLLAFGLSVVAAGSGLRFTWLLQGSILPNGMDVPRGSSFLCWLVFAAVGAVLARRRASSAVGWLLLTASLTWQVYGVAGSYRATALVEGQARPAADMAAWVWEWAWAPGILAVFVLPLLFPDGRLPSRRWRPAAALLVVGATAITAAVALRPGALPSTPMTPNPMGLTGAETLLDLTESIGTAAFVLGAVLALLAPIVRYRRAGDVERHQLRWFATAAVVILSAWTVASILEATGAHPTLLADLRLLPLVLLPIAIAVAILQYRLYDIDVVLHRGLVYGTLALFIGAVYVAVVVGMGQLIGVRTDQVPLALVATVVSAVAFAPLRVRLQAMADRVVYGRRASPYDVLATVTSRMTAVTTSREVLGELARTAAEAVGARAGAVWLRSGTELRRSAIWPDHAPEGRGDAATAVAVPDDESAVTLPGLDCTYPVVRHGRLLGAVGVELRRGERLRPSDHVLLGDLAAAAWLVLDNVGLIDELRASRQRLVTAQDAERQRIERDLHDGAQQRFLELALTLRLAQDQLVDRQAEPARETLDAAQEALRAALAELRELARGIHPPILTSRGLDAALESLAERAPLPVVVHGNTPRLPSLIEATAYFVVSELLTNVIKHAHAAQVTIRTSYADDHLRLEVTDDGIGGADPASSGLQGLADRVATVDGRLRIGSPPGGGTQVEVVLPCA